MRKANSGFTLIEIMVTLSIIVVLAGFTYGTFSFERKTRSIDKGVEALFAMARAARTYAIMNGVEARFIINYNDADEGGFLRQIGIVVEDADNPGNWYAVDRGTYLPEGVYVVPRGNKVDFSENWDLDGESGTYPRKSEYKYLNNDTSEDTGVYCVEYPTLESVPMSRVSEGGCAVDSTEWIGIRFAPNGRIGGGVTSNYLIVAAGVWNADGLTFEDGSAMKAVGFKINGGTYARNQLDLL